MFAFTCLFIGLLLAVAAPLASRWFAGRCIESELAGRFVYTALPWLPLATLEIYALLWPLSTLVYRVFFGIGGLFALVASLVNCYCSLWNVLIRFRWARPRLGPGHLLLRISLSVVITITVIIAIFAAGYALVSYLAGPGGSNYLVEGDQHCLDYRDVSSFFYFSSVTYFSLGYGDYLPRGPIMVSLVFMESLLGYLNSGILIAYALNLFTKLDR